MNRQLPPLIRQMLHPDFYDHEVIEPIELIQTHISFVLLTGPYAYKVKKAISFGFLDFRTLELRQKFCQEELRLNRRLSPELYLDVVSMGLQGETYQLHGRPVVECAVKMRQFPQQDLFSALFESNRLTAYDFMTLARQVAEFHQQAVSSPEIESFGDLAKVQDIHRSNEAISQEFIGLTQTPIQFEQTQQFSGSIFRHHADWLEQRQQLKKIRECHGDLHLNNVCRFHHQIQVFDCIEFNQEFRNIDVLYDVAFMVMDLDYLGREDLAFIFLNQYLERTADYSGVKLLPLYLMMRAMIRGNVISLALKDNAIAPEEKEDLKQRAIAYYQLAHQYTKPRQGQLILMCGLSGSGKSTIASKLSESMRGIHLRSDAIRKHLAGVSLDRTGSDGNQVPDTIYSPAMTQRTYQQLLDYGGELAQEGWTVVLDAKYDRVHLRQDVIQWARQKNIPLTIIHCDAPEADLRSRLRSRQGDISDATEKILDSQIAAFESFEVDERAYVIELNTRELSIEQQIDYVLKALSDRDLR